MQEAQPQAVILVGGEGTRLRPALPAQPKALAPVAGRPFLAWLLVALERQGVRKVVLSTGYRAEAIEAFAEGARVEFGARLELVCVRDPRPLGTGGALRNVAAAVRGDRVLVLNGDSYCPFDVRRLQRLHVAHSARASVWLARVEDAGRFGAVTLAEDGRITAFREKSASAGAGLVNAGIYLLERAALDELPASAPLSLEREVFPQWLAAGGLYGLVGGEPLIDIGTPESYALADEHVDWQRLILAGA
ncbi:MAG: nucleotidyltransferase family protein [Myxococcales bacterium]|nr:nucleotidyltransferase family protein [Myxococcales bacterium]